MVWHTGGNLLFMNAKDPVSKRALGQLKDKVHVIIDSMRIHITNIGALASSKIEIHDADYKRGQ